MTTACQSRGMVRCKIINLNSGYSGVAYSYYVQNIMYQIDHSMGVIGIGYTKIWMYGGFIQEGWRGIGLGT